VEEFFVYDSVESIGIINDGNGLLILSHLQDCGIDSFDALVESRHREGIACLFEIAKYISSRFELLFELAKGKFTLLEECDESVDAMWIDKSTLALSCLHHES
jgi:hypothetical protein